MGNGRLRYEMDSLAFLNDCPVGVAIVDVAKGKRLFVNRALVTMFAASSATDLLERDLPDTWVDPAGLDEIWSTMKEGRALVDCEAARKRFDGSVLWVLMHSQSVTFEGKKAAVVWHTDVTARKQAEEARQRSERRLAEAVENFSDGFALFDPDDRLVFCNRMFREVNPDLAPNIRPGMTFEDMLRENIQYRRIVPAIGREEAYIQERLSSHRNPQKPILSKRSDGRWLLLKEERAEDGSTYLSTTDLTVLREREEELLLAKEHAERLSRIKSHFLANMSHELRTPLNAIIGFSEVLSGEYFGPLGAQKYREYADDIWNSSKHLLLLINEILDLSAIEAGERLLNEIDLVFREYAGECAAMMAVEARRKGIEFVMALPEDLPLLHADPLALKQVLLNLLSNAIKYTPGGGCVTLEARANRDWFTIAVTDTGPGIPEDELEGITEPFVRLESDAYQTQEGTGLGLPIVKSLMTLHDGELKIESAPGEGTRAVIRFPV